MEPAPTIRAQGLVKRYGQTTVLDGLDVTVGSGITGLLGANGAGKTTLLGLILGLHHADDGQLEVLGLDPRRAGPDVRARIGYAPEHHELPADLQAAELVRHVAELHGLPRRAATERANDTLWEVGLGEERFRGIGTMSTGQRQRVKLAQALAHDPRLLLLDEPTDGLDPMQRQEMLTLIARIGSELGIDVVLSSHRLGEVERICGGVVILDAGRVVRAGRLDDLQDGASELVVDVDGGGAELLGALQAAGWTVTSDGTTLCVDAGEHADAAADAVRDAVADRGLALHRLEVRRASLEDVFFDTGGTSGEVGNRGGTASGVSRGGGTDVGGAVTGGTEATGGLVR